MFGVLDLPGPCCLGVRATTLRCLEMSINSPCTGVLATVNDDVFVCLLDCFFGCLSLLQVYFCSGSVTLSDGEVKSSEDMFVGWSNVPTSISMDVCSRRSMHPMHDSIDSIQRPIEGHFFEPGRVMFFVQKSHDSVLAQHVTHASPLPHVPVLFEVSFSCRNMCPSTRRKLTTRPAWKRCLAHRGRS